MEDKRNEGPNPGQGGIGRANFIENAPHTGTPPAEEKEETMTDRQEGNMDHGETGGDMTDDSYEDGRERKPGNINE